MARYFAAAGETELALDWLEKGYQERDMQMVRIKSAPHWDSLRAHPRFRDLLRQMKLPQQQ